MTIKSSFELQSALAFLRNGIHGEALLALESANYYLEDSNRRLVTKDSWPSILHGETLRIVLLRSRSLPKLISKRQSIGTARPIILVCGDSLAQYAERYPQGVPYLRNGDCLNPSFRLLC